MQGGAARLANHTQRVGEQTLYIYMALPPKIRDLINQLARACETQRNVDFYSKPPSPSLLEDLPLQIPL